MRVITPSFVLTSTVFGYSIWLAALLIVVPVIVLVDAKNYKNTEEVLQEKNYRCFKRLYLNENYPPDNEYACTRWEYFASNIFVAYLFSFIFLFFSPLFVIDQPIGIFLTVMLFSPYFLIILTFIFRYVRSKYGFAAGKYGGS